MIQLLIPVAASLIGAWMQSRAANKAADTQQEGAQEALALNREIYQQQRADLGPYRDMGGQAMGTLGGLMGFSPGAGGGGGTLAAPVDPMSRPPIRPDGSRDRRGQPITGYAVPRPPTAPQWGMPQRGTLGAPGGTPEQQQTASAYRGQRMRAPDGRVVLVPPDQVDQALANGGVPV